MIQDECGVTEISNKNAEELLRLWGKPVRLDFKADMNRGDYFVTAHWADSSSFTFSGFAWGYRGEGPTALQRFLTTGLSITDMTIHDIPIDKFRKTDMTYQLKA